MFNTHQPWHRIKKVYDVNGQFCFQGMKQDGLYVWEPVMEQAYLSTTKPANNMELWHLRMGHLNITDLKRLQKLSFGMDFSGKEQLEFCESCCRAKMSSTPFKNEGVKAEKKFQYIYADIVGPFPVKTPDSFEYSLTLSLTNSPTKHGWKILQPKLKLRNFSNSL